MNNISNRGMINNISSRNIMNNNISNRNNSQNVNSNNSITLRLDGLQSRPTIMQPKVTRSNNYSLNVGSVNDSISVIRPKYAMELYDDELLNVLNINQSHSIDQSK